MRVLNLIFLIVAAVTSMPGLAQSDQMPMPHGQHGHHTSTHPQTQGQPQQNAHTAHPMSMGAESLVEQTLQRSTAGTSAEPVSTPSHMLMTNKGGWTLMFHANAFLSVEQQSGPRGGDKIFSTNWFMPMAQRKLGPGQLTLRMMNSLEPATVTGRFYPELFQQGETAFGKPIVDGQHPHEFFMELAAIYDLKLAPQTLLSFYAAPVGDPALGPTAYPHRTSASENPVATLGHHLQDSSHIADDVITVGITHRKFRLEASGFHGREPNEGRWNIDSGRIDSWSTRVTVNPAADWSLQYSLGHLTSAEALHPEEDIRRMTVSVMYNRPLTGGNWATTLLWGRNKNLPDGLIWNSYLAESTLKFLDTNYAWTRIENVDRTNELLPAGVGEPHGFGEEIIGRVQSYTVGYDREFSLIPQLSTALGAQITWYGVPASLQPFYGNPVGGMLFLRVRPFGNMH